MNVETSSRIVVVCVPGHPRPGGSKRAFVTKTGRAVVVEACKANGPWRARVALAGQAEMDGQQPFQGPLRVMFSFTIQRPLSHFGSGKGRDRLRKSARPFPTIAPDLTKLVRAAEDALTGIVWRDDAQIVWQAATKKYGLKPGCRITVGEAMESEAFPIPEIGQQ